MLTDTPAVVIARFPPLTNESFHAMDYDKLIQEPIKPVTSLDDLNLPKVFCLPWDADGNPPNDDVFTYVRVTDLYGFRDVKAGEVVLIAGRDAAAREALELAGHHPALFGVDLSVLAGFPDIEYPDWFHAATVPLDRVAYRPLVADLRANAEREQRADAESKSVTLKRLEGITRADGTVKRHKSSEPNPGFLDLKFSDDGEVEDGTNY